MSVSGVTGGPGRPTGSAADPDRPERERAPRQVLAGGRHQEAHELGELVLARAGAGRDRDRPDPVPRPLHRQRPRQVLERRPGRPPRMSRRPAAARSPPPCPPPPGSARRWRRPGPPPTPARGSRATRPGLRPRTPARRRGRARGAAPRRPPTRSTRSSSTRAPASSSSTWAPRPASASRSPAAPRPRARPRGRRAARVEAPSSRANIRCDETAVGAVGIGTGTEEGVKIQMLSYAHGACADPLLGETIGHNLARTIARVPDAEALVDCGHGVRYTYARVRRGRRPAGRRDARGRPPQGRTRRRLEPEPRRVGPDPVRDGPRRGDPRQHQSRLPRQRAPVRAYAIGLPLDHRLPAPQGLRLRRDGRPRPPGAARARARDLLRHARLGGARLGIRLHGRPRRLAGRARLRRPDQHPVHERHHGLPEGRDAHPPQHPQQRLLRRRDARLHRA